jgi:hypothetical protein
MSAPTRVSADPGPNQAPERPESAPERLRDLISAESAAIAADFGPIHAEMLAEDRISAVALLRELRSADLALLPALIAGLKVDEATKSRLRHPAR